MEQTNNELKSILIDVDSFQGEFDSKWKILSSKIPITFLTTDASNKRKSYLSQIGNVLTFKSFNNSFAFVDNNNIIVNMLHENHINSSEVIVVTNALEHIEQISSYGLKCVHLTNSYNSYKVAPDYISTNINGVVDIILGKNGGLLAESIDKIKNNNSYYYILKSIHRTEQGNIEIFSGGRYFAAGTIQSYYHILSNRILSNKHDGREYKKFVDIFEVMIKFCGSKIINPILISVPPKPGNNNRFEKILQKLCYELNFENGMSYIFCNKDYGNNKIRGTQDREANLDGCFTIDSEAFKDRNVIIIDDVLASGATLREITKQLYLKGASSVTGFVMAINQLCTPWQRVRFNPLLCPKCNSEMKLRINSYNLSMFYGCCSYPKCNYTIDYNEGLSKIKTLNQMKYIDNGNDDFDF